MARPPLEGFDWAEQRGQVKAFDKTPDRTHTMIVRHEFLEADRTPLDLAQRLVLAQIATDAKSNEITAVPQLLKLLSLKGTIVTVDALNCQRAIAQQIIDQGGDYAFALKGNQGTLHTDVAVFLDDPLTKATTEHTTVDADHGRIETRGISVSTDIDWLQERHRWPGLEAIGKVTRTRETGDKISTETAYYLFSTPITAERGGEVVRSHWGVENRLHWRLDVTMNEDAARNRMDNGPHNLCSATWRSTSWAGRKVRHPYEQNSKKPHGITIISSNSSPYFEMRLPCPPPGNLPRLLDLLANVVELLNDSFCGCKKMMHADWIIIRCCSMAAGRQAGGEETERQLVFNGLNGFVLPAPKQSEQTQATTRPIVSSTSSAILPPEERTEPSGHRPCTNPDLLRAKFGNVTEPLQTFSRLLHSL